MLHQNTEQEASQIQELSSKQASTKKKAITHEEARLKQQKDHYTNPTPSQDPLCKSAIAVLWHHWCILASCLSMLCVDTAMLEMCVAEGDLFELVLHWAVSHSELSVT